MPQARGEAGGRYRTREAAASRPPSSGAERSLAKGSATSPDGADGVLCATPSRPSCASLRMPLGWAAVALLAAASLPSAFASEGDSLPTHRGCVYHCQHGDAPGSLRLIESMALRAERPVASSGREGDGNAAMGRVHTPRPFVAPKVPRSVLCSAPASLAGGALEGAEIGSRSDQELEDAHGLSLGGSPSGANDSAWARSNAELRLLGWTCASDCDYLCTRAVERSRLAAGGHSMQYHGKWDFVRVYGVQEPASVLMSLANLGAHLWGITAVCRAEKSATAPQRSSLLRPSPTVLLFFFSSSVAWLCSATFHARDIPVTERADYLCAGASVGAGALLAAQSAIRTRSPLGVGTLAVALLGPLVVKGRSMVTSRFDYGGWMRLCGMLMLVQALGWSIVIVRGCRGEKGKRARDARVVVHGQAVGGRSSGTTARPNAWRVASSLCPPPAVAPLVASLALLVPATMLEIFDFPPVWGVFDAHAAWHAATVPVTLLLYRFLAGEASRRHKPEHD